MAVKLRLKRMGSKQKPFYRIVAADARSPRDGRFIETVGTYNPINSEKDVKINEEVVILMILHHTLIVLSWISWSMSRLLNHY